MARTHVVLTDELIDEIDRVAGRRGRSRFLEDAAREKLRRLELETALAKTSGLITRNHEDWRDRKSVARWVRRTRRTEAS